MADLTQVAGATVLTLVAEEVVALIPVDRRYNRYVRIQVAGIARSQAVPTPEGRRFSRCARIPVAATDRSQEDRILEGLRFVHRIVLGRAVRHRGAVLRLRVRIMDGVRMTARGCTATMRGICCQSRWEVVPYLPLEGSSRTHTFRTSHRLRHKCMPICHRHHRAIRLATTRVTLWCMTR